MVSLSSASKDRCTCDFMQHVNYTGIKDCFTFITKLLFTSPYYIFHKNHVLYMYFSIAPVAILYYDVTKQTMEHNDLLYTEMYFT